MVPKRIKQNVLWRLKIRKQWHYTIIHIKNQSNHLFLREASVMLSPSLCLIVSTSHSSTFLSLSASIFILKKKKIDTSKAYYYLFWMGTQFIRSNQLKEELHEFRVLAFNDKCGLLSVDLTILTSKATNLLHF